MAVFNEKIWFESQWVKSRYAHRYFIIKPDQITRLRCLAESANLLFKPWQQISLVELLYAALWRHADNGGRCSRVTILESRTSNSCLPARVTQQNGAEQFSTYALTGAADYLGSESLIGIAHRIRCCMTEACDDFPYEGWLIDSLVERGGVPSAGADLGDLVLSVLPLPDVLGFLYGESGRSTLTIVRTEDGTLAESIKTRICCINIVGKSTARIHENTDTGTAGAFMPVEWNPQDLISIDMYFPASEIDDLQSLYAGYDSSGYDLTEYCLRVGSARSGFDSFDRDNYRLDLGDPDSPGLTGYGFLCDEFFDN